MIYLAGKITNSDKNIEQANKDRFTLKAQELRELGFTVYNPVVNEPQERTAAFYYAFDLRWIHENKPEAIYVMKDWETSLGTAIEIHTAELLGIKIIYETV